VDFARPRDSGNKRWLVSPANVLYFVLGRFESGGHFLSGHIAGCKYKLTHGILLKSPLFQKVVADTLVGGGQDPAIFADEWKPCFVEGAAWKVIEVAFEPNSQFCQRF
jgi:hypothetical protein